MDYMDYDDMNHIYDDGYNAHNDYISKLETDKDKLSSYIERLEKVCSQLDEALAWESGGEPLPTLTNEARSLYRNVLQSKPL